MSDIERVIEILNNHGYQAFKTPGENSVTVQDPVVHMRGLQRWITYEETKIVVSESLVSLFRFLNERM